MNRKIWIVAAALALALVVGALGSGVLAQDSGPGVIVYSSDRSGNFEVYTLDPQTGLVTQLTNHPASDIEPAWSPDGEFIAFVSDRDGDYELFVMRADGSDLQQLTANNGEDRLPRWQPGGEHIIYSSDVGGKWDLYSISPDGAIVRQLTNDMFDERGPGWGAGQAGQLPLGQATPAVPPATPTPAEPQGTVTGFSLNVRANPGAGAQIVTQIAQGTVVNVIGRYVDNAWVQVRLPDGRIGWVFAELLTFNRDLSGVPVVNAPFIAPPPTATPVLATPTPVIGPPMVTFTADRTSITAGQCVVISWNTDNIDSVFYNGEGVVGWGSRTECPATTTTYNLRVVYRDKVTVDNRYITITVTP